MPKESIPPFISVKGVANPWLICVQRGSFSVDMTMPSVSCSQIDDSWHAWALSCRGGFDFTLLFEETILGILPIGLFLSIAPFRLQHLIRKPHKVVGSGLLFFKLVCLILSLPGISLIFLVNSLLISYIQASWIGLGFSQIVLTALWALPQVSKTKASIAANALNVAGTLVLCLLSYAEHTRSVNPSFLLNIYLFPTLLFDIARTRTVWLRFVDPEERGIAIVSSVAVGTKLLLLVLESMEKRNILKDEYKNYPPEATAGIFNRAFFLWLNSLFKKGFSSLMSVDDLFKLDKQLGSERLQDNLEAEWNLGNLIL